MRRRRFSDRFLQPASTGRSFYRISLSALIALTLVGVVGCSSGCEETPTFPFTVAPVGMNPTGPYIAERSGALAFWGNGALESPVELSSGRVDVIVRARGNPARGQPPRLRVAVGNRDVGIIDVASRTLKDFRITTTVDRAGPTTIKLAFENYLPDTEPIRSRYVFIDRVVLRQPR